MTARHRCAIAVAVTLVLVGTAAARADDTVAPAAPGTSHINSPSTLTTDGGSVLRLPPGYWMDEPTYKRQDDNFKLLQDEDTRLTAENKSLRASVSGWQPGWKTLLGAVVTGLAAGIYLGHKL